MDSQIAVLCSVRGKRKETCEKSTVFPEEQILSTRTLTHEKPSVFTRAQHFSNSSLYKSVYIRIQGICDF